MDEWNGLNPEEAKENINNFVNAANDFADELNRKIKMFGEELSLYWCSPKAVEFGTKATNDFNNLNNIIRNKVLEIEENARCAYNIVARQFGEDTISIFAKGISQSIYGVELFFDMKEISPDGITGMQKKTVRDHILPAFESSMKDVSEMIDELPTSIALYDDEDGQQHAYATGINNMKKLIESEIDSLITQIKGALETEIDTSTTATNQAIETLIRNA